MIRYNLRSLKELETETIYIIREAFAMADKPCMILSNSRNSIVLSHLVRKSFFPRLIPFPFVMVDTGNNHPEAITFRNVWPGKLGATLIVEKMKRERQIPFPEDTLDDLINHHNFTTIFECVHGQPHAGTGRESNREPESIRSQQEVWNILQLAEKRDPCWVYPLANWTELDICLYLYKENIVLPSYISSQKRRISIENGIIHRHEPVSSTPDVV
jgi:sulfate adenylyltransferase subunit 2